MRTHKAHTPRWSTRPAVFIGDTPYELTTSTHEEAQLSVTRITCTTLREDLNKGTNAGGKYTWSTRLVFNVRQYILVTMIKGLVQPLCQMIHF